MYHSLYGPYCTYTHTCTNNMYRTHIYCMYQSYCTNHTSVPTCTGHTYIYCTISHNVKITHLHQQHVQDISLVSVIRTSHIPHTCANSMFFPIFSSVQTSLVLLLVTFRIHSLSSPKCGFLSPVRATAGSLSVSANGFSFTSLYTYKSVLR